MINRVTLLGNLGADPTLRHTSNGTPVANFRMATNDSWTTDGKRQERTEWHNITIWGKMGTAAAEFLVKGRQVYVEGRLQTSTYKDKEGVQRYKTEVIASTVKFLGGRGEKDVSAGVDGSVVPTAEVEPTVDAEAQTVFAT